MSEEKRAYISGPLTGLAKGGQHSTTRFYERIADMFERITGMRAFLPHEHYDPIKHQDYSAREVDDAERRQITEGTSILIAVAVAPSWGGGIEVEMANQSRIPVIILCRKDDLAARKISRLLLGNPAVVAVITYRTEEEALERLERELVKMR